MKESKALRTIYKNIRLAPHGFIIILIANILSIIFSIKSLFSDIPFFYKTLDFSFMLAVIVMTYGLCMRKKWSRPGMLILYAIGIVFRFIFIPIHQNPDIITGSIYVIVPVLFFMRSDIKRYLDR